MFNRYNSAYELILIFFFHMRISSLFVDFSLTMCQFSRAHHKEVVNMSWVDWYGKMLKDRKLYWV